MPQTRTDIKKTVTEWLLEKSSHLEEYAAIMRDTDQRIEDYVWEVCVNAEGHNLMEQLAVWKFFKMRDEGQKWNRKRVQHFIKAWESYEYVDESGSRHVKMTMFQCFAFANIYGWTKRDLKRVVRDVLIYCPRKVGKSTMISGLASYELGFGPLNAHVFVGANSADQAGILFGMIKNIYQNADPLHEYSKVNRTKLWVTGKKRNAYAQAVANDASKLDGKNPSCRIMDEIAQAKLDQVKNSWLVRNVLDSGMTARTEPLRVDITTASTVLDGPFREYKEALETELIESFLQDKVLDPTNFAIIMQPDEGDAEEDEKTWLKVNPHLGEELIDGKTTVLLENYKTDWQKMSKTASGLTEFRTKYLNVFTENQEKVWIAYDSVKAHMVDVTLGESEKGRQCAISFDLSQRDDFSVVGYTLFYKETRQFLCYLDYYLPEGTLPGHQNEQLYREWVKAGYLKLCKGEVIDYVQIANDILQRAEFLDVRRVSFDANKAQELRNTLDNSVSLKGALVPFSQTNGSYNIPFEVFERLFYGRQDNIPEGLPPYGILFNNNPITAYCFANASVDEDKLGNKRPVKMIENRKIDATVVTLMGIGSWFELKK